jgi:hypothetical protein
MKGEPRGSPGMDLMGGGAREWISHERTSSKENLMGRNMRGKPGEPRDGKKSRIPTIATPGEPLINEGSTREPIHEWEGCGNSYWAYPPQDAWEG